MIPFSTGVQWIPHRNKRTAANCSLTIVLNRCNLGISNLALGTPFWKSKEMRGLMGVMLVVPIFVTGLAMTPDFDETLVNIPGLGKLQGSLLQGGDVVEFVGIPYASAPVGNLRFAPPVATPPWRDVRKVTTFMPGCPQNCTLMKSACPDVSSEDCLFMNIWAPSQQLLEKIARETKPSPQLSSYPSVILSANQKKKSNSIHTKEDAARVFDDSYIPLNLVQSDIVHRHVCFHPQPPSFPDI